MPEDIADEESDLGKFQNSNLCTITYEQVRTAMRGEAYTFQPTSAAAAQVRRAVNQGIDSRLEACFSPDRGDRYDWDNGRLHGVVSPESFPTLLRRLFESDPDGEGPALASDMLTTIGFNDLGEFVGREAMGLD